MTAYKLNQLRFVGDNYESDAFIPASHQTYPIAAPSRPSMALGQLAPPPALPSLNYSFANVNLRQILLGIAVIVVVALVLRQLMKLADKTKKVERNTVVQRMSTKELAQRLYDRLETKGSRTNTSTMRSLARLSQ